MKIFVFIIGYIIILCTIIPSIRSDNWIFRIFEYPRFQKLVITCIIIIAFLPLREAGAIHDLIFIGLLGVNLLYLAYRIFPYTPMAKKQMLHSTCADGENEFSMLICNVFQENRNASALLHQVVDCNPDLVLLVEVDAYWNKALEVLHEHYPYRILHPLGNTYGICLYSRLELVDPKVKFLIKNDIPSIFTTVKLRSGELIKLYGLHPEPPVPNENPRSTERDAEILTVAKEVQQTEGSTIVAGDLNDVAWSYTTELFLKVSGLLDPRRGRGFFNTFHVKYPMLQWPLDHVFCSPHFHLLDLKRLPDVGSDHYPIFISVKWAKVAKKEQASNKIPATKEDEEMASEKVQKV